MKRTYELSAFQAQMAQLLFEQRSLIEKFSSVPDACALPEDLSRRFSFLVRDLKFSHSRLERFAVDPEGATSKRSSIEREASTNRVEEAGRRKRVRYIGTPTGRLKLSSPTTDIPPASIRDVVISTLALVLKVPSRPTIIDICAQACFYRSIPTSAFAYLRRDDKKFFESNSLSRPTWIVGTIDTETKELVTGLVATSDMAPIDRVVSKETHKILRLKTICRLAELLAMTEQQIHFQVSQIKPLLRALISDLFEVRGREPFLPPLADILSVAQREIAMLEPADLERRQIALREIEKWDIARQYWGR